MTNCKDDECVVKVQENGEWRCFRCWQLFFRADMIEVACEQVEAEPLEDEDSCRAA